MHNVNEQINRMKAMMTYGLTSESKKPQYSSVEYNAIAADGKKYGIVREGTKFYIKVANSKNATLKEDFDYIGGFRNRKDYEYSSFANAIKNFEMKMSSINEAANNKTPLIETWNPDKKEELTIEATDKMRREIARQRQIMNNCAIIQEKKNYTIDSECAATQKNNIKKTSDGVGDPMNNGGDPFTKKTKGKQVSSQKSNVKKEFKPVVENESVLAWNDSEDYLDTKNGTSVGCGAPFGKECCCDDTECCENVSEETVMHTSDNQNKPAVGINKVGSSKPFDKKITEGMEDNEDDFEGGTSSDDLDGNEIQDEYDDNQFDNEYDDETPYESNDEEMPYESEDEESDEDDIESRLAAIEDTINKIADKLNVSNFDDDKLYDDDESSDYESEDEDEFSHDENESDFGSDDYEQNDDYEQDDDDYEVYESVNYRKVMAENEMDYFGKHPAYRKEVMRLPSSNHQEFDGYYDMNDDSVRSQEPYGEKIGDSDPFDDVIGDAVTEAINRFNKKKR